MTSGAGATGGDSLPVALDGPLGAVEQLRSPAVDLARRRLEGVVRVEPGPYPAAALQRLFGDAQGAVGG